MNDYLFQLAMVINTSHDNFYENLMNIVIYILGYDVDNVVSLCIQEIANDIEKKIKLEFTEKEINKAIKRGIQKDYIIESSDEVPSKYFLGEPGIKKIHMDKLDKFSCCIDEYIEKYDICNEFTNDKVKELIHKFLYGCIGENINILVLIVRGDYSEKINDIQGFNNAERKIINDFLDWKNDEKDEILFRLISFSVDYSRLTVKKSAKQFSDLLKGKVFYLDANIFFRLMGINNLRRKETTQKFVDKCKEEHIKLLYTNLTRQEIFDSIDFHISELKKFVKSYRGYGSALNTALEKENIEKSFYMEYYHWAKRNDSFRQFDDFKSYLKSQFYKCCDGISCEEVGTIEISSNHVQSLLDKKKQRAGYDNVVIDIKNLSHIKEKRRKSRGDVVSWNTKYYLISADHRLIEWVDETFSPRNPIAVLPSVWYSLILKLKGREKEGYQSFLEFVKLRYVQDNGPQKIQHILSAICDKTSNGELQDRLLDEIYDSNQEVNAMSKLKEEDIEALVDEKYDNILEEERTKAYAEGKDIGERKIAETAENNREIGIKIGKIEEKIDQTEKELNLKSQRIVMRNKVISVLIIVAIYITVFLLCGIAPVQFLKKWKWFLPIITVPLTALLSGKFLPINHETVHKEQRFKKENELKDLQNELEELRKRK